MKIIQGGGGRKISDRLRQQRNGLLALIHIAKKDLALSDDEYGACLLRFGAASAAALSIAELEELVRHFKGMGWKRQRVNASKSQRVKGPDASTRRPSAQIEILQGKILERAFVLERGAQRMAGLVKKHCGVDRLEWCRDAAKLKQVLRVMTLLG